MQKIIDAERSDIFDVLAYVAYATTPLTREERAARAKIVIATHFTSKQQGFFEFLAMGESGAFDGKTVYRHP